MSQKTDSESNKPASRAGFKEYVAATFGAIILIGTILLLLPPLIRSPPDLISAQGIFAILGGWGGVVLGYYFGRVPAERAADEATKSKEAAKQICQSQITSVQKDLEKLLGELP